MKSFDILLIFLGLICVLSEFSWEKAPDDVLSKYYFPYERCVLERSIKNQLEPKSNIHDQTVCEGHKEGHLLQLHRRCWLGSRQQRIDDGACIFPRKFVYCRKLSQRQGFWYHWKGLSSPFSRFGYEGELLETLQQKNFNSIVFMGDSMAIQMAQRFACGLLRRNISAVHYGDFFSMNELGAAMKFSTGTKGVDLTAHRLRSYLGTFNNTWSKYGVKIQGIEYACIKNGTRDRDISCLIEYAKAKIEEATYNEFLRFRNKDKWGTVLHIVILPIILKNEWEWEPFVRGMTRGIRENNIENRFLILSPFAQHFYGNSQGMYGSHITKATSKQRAIFGHQFDHMIDVNQTIGDQIFPCLAHHSSTDFSSVDGDQFLRAMNAWSSTWPSNMKWLDVTHYSNPWYDLHPEAGSTGWIVDCTHYAYNPMMYDVIWREITTRIF